MDRVPGCLGRVLVLSLTALGASLVVIPNNGLWAAPEPAEAPERVNVEALKEGDRVPLFEAITLEGKPIRLSDYRGKYVLLDFWATWCGPCRRETPYILEAYKMYHDDGLEVIGINLDEDRQAVTDYIDKHGIPWPQVFYGKEWENEIGELYEFRGIPQQILLDRELGVLMPNARGDRLLKTLKLIFGLKRGGSPSHSSLGSEDSANSILLGGEPAETSQASHHEGVADASEMKDWQALPWHPALEPALEEARAQNKFVFVDFSTSRCGWCRKMESETYSHPAIWQKLKDHFILCHLDGKQEEGLAQNYKVVAYPSMYVLDGNGESMLARIAYYPPEKFYNRFLKPLENAPGRLTQWHIIGPFDNTDEEGFATAYPPEQEIDLTAEYAGKRGQVRWQAARPNPFTGEIHLKDIFGNTNQTVFYAYTAIHTSIGTQAHLRLGSCVKTRVWLNGSAVHENDIYRGFDLDQDIVPVRLEEGRNEVLLKLANLHYANLFSVRVTDEDGKAIEGCVNQAEAPASGS